MLVVMNNLREGEDLNGSSTIYLSLQRKLAWLQTRLEYVNSFN